MAGDFADPEKFDDLINQLEFELLSTTIACAEVLKNAQGMDVTLLSNAFQELIGSFDNCIKGLTTSSNYQNDSKLKAERFAQLLEHYLEIALLAIDPKMLEQDSALQRQAERLINFLPARLVRLKTKMSEDPEKALLPSENFSASMASLGSNMAQPARAMPGSLEDFSQCFIKR
ncbi:MAG: hypothetical protein HWD61_12835 [Parachlamydiaceae bacterium]|nr:MAG: hypothetical protein HWD61_12835 [Parachlamydiaceae bacterium]